MNHSFELTVVEQPVVDETYLWAKFQIENAPFGYFRNILQELKSLVKMIITREIRREGMSPLQVFHTSLRSTCGRKMEPKRLEHLGMFPR